MPQLLDRTAINLTVEMSARWFQVHLIYGYPAGHQSRKDFRDLFDRRRTVKSTLLVIGRSRNLYKPCSD